jgi:quinol monooxygenase YgiN
MAALVIVAHIHAKAGKEDAVRAELEKVIPPTRAEEGCVTYDLHQDNEDPTHFMFYEVWETKPHWEAHQRTAHLDAMRAATEDARESIAVYQMTHIA